MSSREITPHPFLFSGIPYCTIPEYSLSDNDSPLLLAENILFYLNISRVGRQELFYKYLLELKIFLLCFFSPPHEASLFLLMIFYFQLFRSLYLQKNYQIWRISSLTCCSLCG